jgi:hypothetical protein
MRVVSSSETVAFLLFAGALVACSSSDDGGASDAGADGIVVGPMNDATPATDAPIDGAAPGAIIRVAQLSPDLGAIDLCYRATGTTSWTGPIFAMLHPPADAGAAMDSSAPVDATVPDGETPDDAEAYDASYDAEPSGDASAPHDAGAPYDAGAPIGVAFESVSTYETLDGSGTFDVAIVESGSVSCTTPQAVDRITLLPSEHATLVVMGSAALDASAGNALQVSAFADDLSVDPSAARVRFIHAGLGASRAAAIPAVAIDFVFADQTSVTVAADVEPGQAASETSTSPVIDMLGYGVVAVSTMPASIELRPLGDDAGASMWVTSVSPLGLAASSLHTAFVHDSADGPAVLYCEDLSVGGTSSPCTTLAAP